MKTVALLAVLLASALPALAQDNPGQLINLSCMEALTSIDRKELMGVFFFISEKDGPHAFADLIMHDKKAFKLYVAKVGKDRKAVSGVSAWDHEAMQFALSIYDSPLRATIADPGDKAVAQLRDLAAAPVVSLEAIEAARRKG